MGKGLKLQVRKFEGLIPTLEEVTGEKLVGGLLPPPTPPPNMIVVNKKVSLNVKSNYRPVSFLLDI